MLIDDIKQEEGFKGIVYKCTEGFDTIGYGTRLPLSEKEAEMILEYRLNILKDNLSGSLYMLDIDKKAWDILYNMVYQMGVKGVLNFKNMIKALEAKDYKRAGDEMLDSKWAKQTPARANRLSKAMKAI